MWSLASRWNFFPPLTKKKKKIKVTRTERCVRALPCWQAFEPIALIAFHKCVGLSGGWEWGPKSLANTAWSVNNALLGSLTSTHHVLHVGCRGVYLAPELVVEVQDELGVAVADGPLPPLLGLPPVSLLVQILVQDPVPAGFVREHHHGGSGPEQKEQSGAPQPALAGMLHRSGEKGDFKLSKRNSHLGKQTNVIGPLHPICWRTFIKIKLSCSTLVELKRRQGWHSEDEQIPRFADFIPYSS